MNENLYNQFMFMHFIKMREFWDKKNGNPSKHDMVSKTAVLLVRMILLTNSVIVIH